MQNNGPRGLSSRNGSIRMVVSAISGGEFLLDKGGQCAQGCKGVCADLVIIDDEAKVIFHGRQDRDDGHGIEFGHGAQQGRFLSKVFGARPKLQGLCQQIFNGFQCVHERLICLILSTR